MVTSGQAAELVDLAGAPHHDIDLLEGNEIRSLGPDHLGEPFQVVFSVHPLSVVNVVTEHPEIRRLIRSGDPQADGRGRGVLKKMASFHGKRGMESRSLQGAAFSLARLSSDSLSTG